MEVEPNDNNTNNNDKITEVNATIAINDDNKEINTTKNKETLKEVVEVVTEKNDKLKKEKAAMRNFYVIACGYLLFTLTDSGLRMIVLLELYQRHFNALQISLMFTLYEFLGVITNLVGGILGSRLGLRFCLLTGLITQIIGIGILCGLQRDWPRTVVIIYIIIAQGFSGVAKDMVKLGGKSVTKLVKHDDDLSTHQSALFKLVAYLTGAKNSIKGAGFFLGAFLLNFTGYIVALVIMAVMNLVVIPFALLYLDRTLAVSKRQEPLSLKEVFNKGRDVNILSLARMFLFGSRDLWFEVPLPVFLRGTIGWSYMATGALLAGWIIFYGFIQSSTPQLILKPAHLYPITSGRILVPLTIILLIVTILISLATTVLSTTTQTTLYLGLLITGLFLFAFIFAVNSSVHSFLILAYCHRDKVAMNVGFYYMANACGRLVGLIVGGVLYQYVGLYACLWTSAVALFICCIVSWFLGPVPEEEIKGLGD
ncbi:5649_t:CDS:2 [Ambispora leptoticha]|uniref:5649_t:CDS:1 n=1 Tax=Ambispora leptoticha TaxID=144679 RepID=A0A9N9CE47_9GLOM|nr:5649_t:CDS:2 [Ambispora leptoticha]